MKRFLLFFLLLPFWLFSQTDAQFCEQLQGIQKVLKENHFQPKPIDENLSSAVYKLVLNAIDESREFLTQSDLILLEEDATKIHQYLLNKNCSFTHKYATILTKRLDFIINYLEELKKEQLDYSGSESIFFRKEKNRSFLVDEQVLKNYWNQRIRFFILKKYIENYQDKSDKDFAELAETVKEKVIEGQLCDLNQIKHYKGNIQNFINDSFLNAIANYNDPHSSFFTFSEKQFFENILVKSQQSFGIVTSKNKFGEIIVKKVVVGSPAFKSGNIQKDDKIIKIISNEDQLNTQCITNSDINSFLNDIKHKSIQLHTIDKNGKSQFVNLTKEKISNDDNAIHSYILGDDFKVGYIRIPSFYTDTESVLGNGIANDVAKEIFRLQRANIQGLILNLRFNGGGSMKEAVHLTGLFIDKGPVTTLKFNDGRKVVLKDMKRGTLFTKPIVILVNNQSASASELFAGAMQDYHRAIIVGSTTFGKSTAQIFLPLTKKKNIGFCKVTGEKFYRITGKSHQQIGVMPNIQLPSFYDNLEIGEKFLPHFLVNDSINKNNDYVPFTLVNYQLLKKKSINRVSKSVTFNKVKALNKDFLAVTRAHKGYSVSLNVTKVKIELDRMKTIFERFSAMKDQSTETLSIANTNSFNDYLLFNQDKLKMNTERLNDISKNIYIIEAYHILTDLNQIKNEK